MKKIRDDRQDTIAAIATPIGEAAVGVIRISGKKTFAIADQIFVSKKGLLPSRSEAFRALYGHIVNPETGRRLDEILMLVMKAPHTYTCEDMIEIHGHGAAVALHEILGLVIRQGVRLARPGEFTERAFLGGRIDLSQAEAVLDIIHSKTEASLRSAVDQLGGSLSRKIREFRDELLNCLVHVEGSIDFPDEELDIMNEGKLFERLTQLGQHLETLLQSARAGIIFREGLTTVIAGRPNVGKSSLLNALLRQNRAIVTPLPGTTRDAIEETANIRGIPVRLVDTAGIQKTDCQIEAEGISRSRSYLERADLVLFVLDGSEATREEDRQLLKELQSRPVIYVINKEDLPQKLTLDDLFGMKNGRSVVRLSAKTGNGLALLEEAIEHLVWQGKTQAAEGTLVTHVRHREALLRSLASVHAATEALSRKAPPEIIAVDLRAAIEALGEIVGEIFTEDLLDKIFSQFCIGK